MDLRAKTCCFTGHRDLGSASRRDLEKRLRETIRALAARGIVYFGAGGALGFDMLAERAVLAERKENAAIKLILVLPCRDQAAFWRRSERANYEKLLEQADKVVYVAESYYDGCMLERNRRLVAGSGVCVCYLEKEGGGTAMTVRLARGQGLEVINLAPAL